MAGQIYRQVVQVPRKVQRLAWLFSAPAADPLAWLHKPPSPPGPPTPADRRPLQSLAWLYGPLPSGESMPWRRRPPAPPDPLPSGWAGGRAASANNWQPHVTPVPPPHRPNAGPVKSFVPRDPRVDPRHRRFQDVTSEVLNSLMGSGELYQTGPKAWALGQAAFIETRPPTYNDDGTQGAQPGSRWIDTAAGTIWFNISNATGAAVWKGPF